MDPVQHQPFQFTYLVGQKENWRLALVFGLSKTYALTVKNKYPLPIIDEILDELFGASWFTSLDLCSGFHQIRLKPGEEYRTEFKHTMDTLNVVVKGQGKTDTLALLPQATGGRKHSPALGLRPSLSPPRRRLRQGGGGK